MTVARTTLPHSVCSVSASKDCVLQLRNGDYLQMVLPYKAGSTAWLQLLLKHLTGRTYPSPHLWHQILRRQRIPWHNASLLPAGAVVHRICLVRNPYERMLSFYLNKVHERLATNGADNASAKVLLWPPALIPIVRRSRANATFAEFLRAAAHTNKANVDWVAYAHYGPISEGWNCPGAEAATVYKVETMGSWYCDLVARLGWQQDVASGWPRWSEGGGGTDRNGGCFFRPAGRSCSHACSSRGEDIHLGRRAAMGGAPPVVVPSLRIMAGPTATCSRGERMPHAEETGACRRLAVFYTPVLAARVAKFAQRDLKLFGYPIWTGSVAVAWF